MANIARSSLLTPQQATTNLLKKGYIKLPPGSFLIWILKSDFERLKMQDVIVFKNNMWMPVNNPSKLSILHAVMKQIEQREFETYLLEKKERQLEL